MWRDELPLTLEVAALAAFVIARPVLASFGEAPEVFIAESARGLDIALFALVVVFGPVAAALVAGGVLRCAGPRVRTAAHLVAVGALTTFATWQLLDMLLPLPLAAVALLGAASGVAVAVSRSRGAAVGAFLRYAAIAAVAFLVQFAVASPSSSLIWHGTAAAADPSAVSAISRSIGPESPPIVLVVLDELPTTTLLDGSGRIDAGLFPNIARLAADGTWYRNHTTVADQTPHALSAIVTGDYPDLGDPPTARAHPDNLLTLLAHDYDLHVLEQLTAFCPQRACGASGSPGTQIPALVGDGAGFWARYMVRGGDPGIPTRSEDRLAELADWVATQDFSPSDRPDLYFVHTILPHAAWEYLPDGTRYRSDPLPTGVLPGHVWSDRGTLVGRQRHIMQTQAVDRVLGDLLDRLTTAGVYDDAVVVLTADHGAAFVPNEPRRAATEAQFEQIAWTPLIVKAPGQHGGAVSDANVENIDILPTILELIGAGGVVKVDGRPIGDGDGRPEGDKSMVYADAERTTLDRPGDGGRIALDAEEGFRRVLAAEPTTGTGPGGEWQLIPGSPLVGRAVADLRVGAAAEATVDPGFGEAYDDVDPTQPIAVQIDTTATVEPGTPVVAAVNGVIAGSTLADGAGDSRAHVQVMLDPDAFVPGDNDVRLYVVEGKPGDEVLRPLRTG